jgi:hypothetical protein
MPLRAGELEEHAQPAHGMRSLVSFDEF